jgi:hypothetical protein
VHDPLQQLQQIEIHLLAVLHLPALLTHLLCVVQRDLLACFFAEDGFGLLLLELIVLQTVDVFTLFDVQLVDQMLDAPVQLQELLAFPQFF